MSAALELFSYWRSGAAYRVRIGLGLKALDYIAHPVHLVRDGASSTRRLTRNSIRRNWCRRCGMAMW